MSPLSPWHSTAGRCAKGDGQDTVTVNLADMTAPASSCPANLTVAQDSAAGATVTYTVTDASGQSSSCAFTINAVPPASVLDEKVNGGGSIPVPGGAATFGVRALLSRTGVPQGHLTYQDHVTGQTVKSTTITAVVGSATQVRIFGKATIDGAGSFDFMVEVIDNAEPGSADVFRLQLGDGYTAGGTLTGGNIQVH